MQFQALTPMLLLVDCDTGAALQTFTLYSTSACHLCEMAHEMLSKKLQDGVRFELQELDISESEELVERYGVHIPVLQHPDGRELNWPFSEQSLQLFLMS